MPAGSKLLPSFNARAAPWSIYILPEEFRELMIHYSNNELYEKIDLFGEVLEKIKKDYVDDVNQSKMMDSAINGLLQSLDPYSAYMSPELFKEMQTDTSGEFGGLGIEIGMEAGVVKVISPIDGTPAEQAGIKAGDLIIRLDEKSVKGISLMEAVKMNLASSSLFDHNH